MASASGSTAGGGTSSGDSSAPGPTTGGSRGHRQSSSANGMAGDAMLRSGATTNDEGAAAAPATTASPRLASRRVIPSLQQQQHGRSQSAGTQASSSVFAPSCETPSSETALAPHSSTISMSALPQSRASLTSDGAGSSTGSQDSTHAARSISRISPPSSSAGLALQPAPAVAARAPAQATSSSLRSALPSSAASPAAAGGGSVSGSANNVGTISRVTASSTPAIRRQDAGTSSGSNASANSLGAHLAQQPQASSSVLPSSPFSHPSASASLFGYAGPSMRAVSTATTADDAMGGSPSHALNWRSASTMPGQVPGSNSQAASRPGHSQHHSQQPRTAITSFLGHSGSAPSSQSHGGTSSGWGRTNAGLLPGGSSRGTPNSGAHHTSTQLPLASAPSPRFAQHQNTSLTSQVSTGTASGWTLADPAGWSGWASAGRVGSAFEENQVVLFTWTIPEARLLREEVECSPLPSEVERSVSAGAGKSEVWTTQPIFGDGKWKLELVRSSRPSSSQQSDALRGDDAAESVAPASTTVLSIYLTSMVLDYSPAGLEIPTTVMLGIRPPHSRFRSSRDGTWIWQRFFDYTFRHENEYLECHELPSISELLKHDDVQAQDCFNLTVQVSTGPRATPSAQAMARPGARNVNSKHGTMSPFIVEDNQLVHHSLIHGLERLIDCNATGDVVLIVRERGLRRQTVQRADRADASRSESGSTLEEGDDIVPAPIGDPSDAACADSSQADGCVFVRDRVLWAHSSILSARSEFFRVMLQSNFVEGQELIFDGRRVKALRMQDADFTTVYWLLRYLYLEEVSFVPHEDVRSAALDDDWMSTSSTSAGSDPYAFWEWTPLEQANAGASGDRSESAVQTTSSGGTMSSDVAGVTYHSAHLRSSVSSRQAQHHHASEPANRSQASPTNIGAQGGRRAQSSASQELLSPYGSLNRRQHQQQRPHLQSGSGEWDARPSGARGAPDVPPESDTSNAPLLHYALSREPHAHPCNKPSPASALALYRLAHRYHQEGLLDLAKAHLVGTLTPQSAFAVLLATSVYEELHAHVKAYVLDKWETVSQTPEFGRCCDEVSAGEWGADAGRALRVFMRSLVSPARSR